MSFTNSTSRLTPMFKILRFSFNKFQSFKHYTNFWKWVLWMNGPEGLLNPFAYLTICSLLYAFVAGRHQALSLKSIFTAIFIRMDKFTGAAPFADTVGVVSYIVWCKALPMTCKFSIQLPHIVQTHSKSLFIPHWDSFLSFKNFLVQIMPKKIISFTLFSISSNIMGRMMNVITSVVLRFRTSLLIELITPLAS